MATSARKALAWSFAERYIGLLVSIGSTMLLSRLLTPEQVGIYSMCAAFTAVAGILRDFGVSEYLIQEKDLTHDKLRAAYALAFGIAWSIAAVIFFSRHLVADFYAEPRVADVLLVLTLHFLILPISSPAFALMNRELAFRQIFFLQLVCNATQALTGVTLAWLGFGVMSLAWGPIANVGMQSLILLWLRPKEVLTRPGWREIRTVLRFGSMFVTSRTIEVLSRNAHEPIIAKHYGFESVGLFSRAYGLIDLFHLNVGAAVVRVATPAFAAQHRAGQALGAAYARATALFVSVSWPFFGFVALTAEPIIRVMFGSQWIQAAPIASVLALTALPHGLMAMAPQMLSATGHVARRLRVTLLFSPVHVVGVFVASYFGLLAVASVWALSNLVMLGLYLRELKRTVDLGTMELARAVRPSVVVAAGSIAVQAAVMVLLQQAQVPALIVLMLTFGAGLVAWVLAARLIRHVAYEELARALGAFRRRHEKASTHPGPG